MPDQATDLSAEFSVQFCARVRAAREACGMTQAEIAVMLGISRAAYEKYETRSPLPHRLVERFSAVTGVEIDALFGSLPAG